MFDDLTMTGAADNLAAAPGRRAATRAAAMLQALAPFAVAGLGGLVYAAAFPPLSWTIAAWVALVPLLVVSSMLTPGRAAVAGMIYALAAAAGVAGFLPGMLSSYFGLSTPLSWIAAAAIVALLNGLWVGGFAAWVAWLAHRGAASPLLLAGGFMVCEFARAAGPLGNPWVQIAYSQLAFTPVIQIADLAGVYGIGMLVALVNACAAAAIAPALRGRRPGLSMLVAATALAATLIYGQARLEQRFDESADVRVAVVQGGATPATPAQRPARLARYVELTRAVLPADLVVWPEYAVESYLEEVTPTRAAVLRLSGEMRADLILGGPHFEPSPAGTRYHNSAYLVRAGALAARYDKHRLVPFAEDDFGWVRGRATRNGYVAGVGDMTLPATPLRVGTLLCMEAMLPDLVRRAIDDGAEALVTLSNDAWFGAAEPARHQLDIATLRAVENRRYLIRAAATGVSAVIDPHGRTLARSTFNDHEVLTASVRAAHVRTPYQRCGDAFAWAVIAGVIGAAVRDRFRSRRQHNR